MIEKALEIAADAHRGQADKDGKEYIRHVLRVMMSVEEGDQQIVAILHDVIEKSGYTLTDLKASGFSARILDAVDAISRRNGEDFEGFVKRAAANELARPVKIADLRDNLRQAEDTGAVDGGIKYRQALAILGVRAD